MKCGTTPLILIRKNLVISWGDRDERVLRIVKIVFVSAFFADIYLAFNSWWQTKWATLSKDDFLSSMPILFSEQWIFQNLPFTEQPF